MEPLALIDQETEMTLPKINGKEIHMSVTAAKWFVYDYLASSYDVQYGALCALGLEDEARGIKLTRDYLGGLCEVRNRALEAELKDSSLMNIWAASHTLDESIASAQERFDEATRKISGLLDLAKEIAHGN